MSGEQGGINKVTLELHELCLRPECGSWGRGGIVNEDEGEQDTVHTHAEAYA